MEWGAKKERTREGGRERGRNEGWVGGWEGEYSANILHTNRVKLLARKNSHFQGKSLAPPPKAQKRTGSVTAPVLHYQSFRINTIYKSQCAKQNMPHSRENPPFVQVVAKVLIQSTCYQSV